MINFHTYFSNISYDVTYCPIKFELNTQLECGETKKIGTNEIVEGTKPNERLVLGVIWTYAKLGG